MITTALIFWILMAFSLYGILAVWYKGDRNKLAPTTIAFLLIWVPLAMIGWRAFGAPIQ